jgi:hypothetical protein
MKTWNITTTKTSDRTVHEFTLRDYSSHCQQLKGGEEERKKEKKRVLRIHSYR